MADILFSPGAVDLTVTSHVAPGIQRTYTAISITNPDAETGDATGWTMYSGSLPLARTGAVYGTYMFAVSGSAALPWWGQSVTIPSEMLTAVDAGNVTSVMTAHALGYSGDADSGLFMYECLDASDGFLSGGFTGWLDPSSWTKYNIEIPLPPSTRKVRIAARGQRAAGTENSFYIDEFSARYLSSDRQNSQLLFSTVGDTTTGWTVVTGGIATTAPTYFEPSTLYGGAYAASDVYRDITIDSSLLDAVDGGFGVVDVRWMQGAYNTSGDDGRTYLVFLDGSDSQIGDTYYSSPAVIRASIYFEGYSFKKKVPPGARKVRLGLDMVRTDGTNLDARFSRLSAILTTGASTLTSPVAEPGPATLSVATEQPALLAPPGSVGAYITGEAPSLLVDEGSRSLSPGAASLTVTAGAASAVFGLLAHPGAASVVVTADVTSLGLTDHHVAFAGTGSLEIAPLAPLSLVIEPTIITPDAGTLTIDESATNAVQNELPSPGAATATITGHQVTLQRLFSANTGSGALAITGAAPSLLESVTTVMQPAAAVLLITGQDVVIDAGVVSIPAHGALTASGAAPALRLDMVCSPGARNLLTNWLVTADSTDTADGEWTADGIVIQTAPTVAVSDHAIAQPGAGSAAVTGQAPTVAATAGVWSEPSAGSIAITGQQPTVAQTTSQYPSPNPCTITVDCVGPTPVVGTVIGVPVATVAITSSAPSLVADTNVVISGEAPVIGVAGPGNMVVSGIRLYGSLDGGRDVRLKWPEN